MKKRKPAGPEEAFLASIRANPEDETNLLVYADWLEEQGDPRGEFVRLAAALGNIAADDPYLPTLQGRISALQQHLDARWAATVAVPGQLRRLRRRIESRFGPVPDLYNRTLYESRFLYPVATEKAVNAAERKLGFALPPLLRAVYTHIGNGGLLLCLIGVRGGQTGFDDIGYSNKDIVAGYQGDRILGLGYEDPKPWPEGLIPIYDGLGCGRVDHLDCTTPHGAVWQTDSGTLHKRLDSLEEYLHESVNKWSPESSAFKTL